MGSHQPQVGGKQVPDSDLDEVARDQFGGGDLAPRAAANDGRRGVHQPLQAVQHLVGPRLLQEPQTHTQQGDDQHDAGGGAVVLKVRDAREGQQQQHQRVAHGGQEQPQFAKAGLRLQHIRPPPGSPVFGDLVAQSPEGGLLLEQHLGHGPLGRRQVSGRNMGSHMRSLCPGAGRPHGGQEMGPALEHCLIRPDLERDALRGTPGNSGPKSRKNRQRWVRNRKQASKNSATHQSWG